MSVRALRSSIRHRETASPARALILTLALGGSVLAAGVHGMEADGLPRTYRLDEVTLRVSLQAGNPAHPSRQFVLSGAAASAPGGERVQKTPHSSGATLVEALKELYRMRFFEMPSQYTTVHSVYLKDDGTVATTAQRMLDAQSTQVCVSIQSYEKCVRFGREAPIELRRFAERMLGTQASPDDGK